MVLGIYRGDKRNAMKLEAIKPMPVLSFDVVAASTMAMDSINKSHVAHYYELAADQGHSGTQNSHATLIRMEIVFRGANHLQHVIPNFQLIKVMCMLSSIMVSSSRKEMVFPWTNYLQHIISN
jgi:hypothetical protein